METKTIYGYGSPESKTIAKGEVLTDATGRVLAGPVFDRPATKAQYDKQEEAAARERAEAAAAADASAKLDRDRKAALDALADELIAKKKKAGA